MKYIANPVEVDAFTIIGRNTEGPEGSITLTLSNGKTVECTAEMMARYVPTVGDYWVVQEDGDAYVNPFAVFERKYRPDADEDVLYITPDLLEKLSEAAHDIWMKGKIDSGWAYAPVTNKEAKQHSCLVPYSELTEADKESDRDLARGIPLILNVAGYKIAQIKEASL